MSKRPPASMLVFSEAEYAERLRRARRLMGEHGFDALLVSAPPNVTYLTGYRTNLFDSNFRPFLSVIPRDGDPVLLLPNLEVGVGEETSPFDDIRAWGSTPECIAPDAVSAVAVVAREKGLSGGRIGIERGLNMRIGMGLDQFDQLQEMLPDAEWPNSAALLWALRVVKSPAEVAYIRESQRITDAAYHASLDFAREGVSEKDLLRVLGMKMMEEGADHPGFQIISSGPERYKMTNPYTVDRKLRHGDMVIFDIGSVKEGYYSDITRGFFIGTASDRQREFYEAARSFTETAVNAVRPGVTCADIDRIATQAIVDAGYGDYMIHRTGHSIGLEVHEMPSIAPGDNTVLQPGMVLTIEPGIYDFSIGAFRMEDVVLVTDDGWEYISHAERELTIK
jgi:Xaa-Pro aminopeptidase